MKFTKPDNCGIYMQSRLPDLHYSSVYALSIGAPPCLPSPNYLTAPSCFKYLPLLAKTGT